MYLFQGATAPTQVLSAAQAAHLPPAASRSTAPAKRKVAQVPVQVKIYASGVAALAVAVLATWHFAFPVSESPSPRIAESAWTLPLVFAGLNALAILFP